jgi:hypothetical protein
VRTMSRQPRVLTGKLGCENVQFPGHHDVSFWIPEEFANATRRTIKENRHSYAGLPIKVSAF